jgi:hypothetical protein
MLVLLALAVGGTADRVQFNRDIRPILSEHCVACHGPDAKHRKAKLRLDVREAAIEAGSITPGNPDDSELIARVFSTDPDTVMPHPDHHKPLSQKQKDTLRKWVEQGAEYQPHWAYVPPGRPAGPAGVHPVDHFVRAELGKKGIAPSPEADRRTLVRRLSLDLVGLPPTPGRVEAFANDRSPDAYEKLVDELLASPHYGERMAQPWLDLVRFADTVGYHGDQTQRVFPYRDYVVDSFNRNTPFDQFTREQLAGDLLPNPTPEQLVATCFNRLNMMTREGGAQPKEYLAKYQADRVRTVSITWLGSTLGCAECHDHKYDPFTAKDFYSLAAFFADVRQWGVYADYNYTPNPDLRGVGNDHPFYPEVRVDSPYLQRQQLRVLHQLGAGEVPADWRKSVDAFLAANPTGWATPTPTADGAAVKPDGRVVFPGMAGKATSHTLTLSPPPGPVVAVRLELLPDPAHKGKLARQGALSSVTVTPAFAVRRADGTEVPLKPFFGGADRWEPTRWAGGEPVRGLLAGWKTRPADGDKPHTAVWLLDQPPALAAGDRLVVALKADNLGAARVSVSPLGFVDLARAEPKVNAATYRLATGDPQARELVRQYAALDGGTAPCQVTVAQKPFVTRVLPRGNFLDDTGPVVEPAVPHFLPQPGKTGRLTRLDLADWIVSPDNPLTARVFANRLWKQLFGTGLSAVMEDVGGQGEPPSHPELLDFLATEFSAGWDVKKLVKLLVTSATYKQASRGRPELRDIDPNNRLLAYHPPRRLEAEFVRDNALFAAGLLNLELGGPSSKPYQPAGYYANLQFPNRDYAADAGDRQYRRGLYTHWQRTFLHPMLANFDAPSREDCTASRIVANTPQQALTLLNDPTFVEAARVLATRLTGADDAAKLADLFQRVLAREPKPVEVASLTTYLTGQREQFRKSPADADRLVRVGQAPPPAGDPAELAAWASVCRVVLNLHETITRY